MIKSKHILRLIAALIAAALIFCEPAVSAKDAVTLKSPSRAEVVNITNENVEAWWDDYERYSAADNDKVEELTKPDPVKLRWKGKKGFTYSVCISTDSKFKVRTKYKTKKSYVKLYNLLRSTKYYWKVSGKKGTKTIRSETRSFTTKSIARIIKASGVYNIRDIGGYKTVDGSRSAQGRVYRSADLDEIGEKGAVILGNELKIKTELDLRSDDEIPDDVPHVLKKYINRRGTAYEKIFEEDDSRDRFIDALRVFADSRNYPILVHCVYGRDRTGTLVFLLNGLLGVSKKNLYRDFELSFLTCKGSTKARAYTKQFVNLYRTMRSYADAEKPLSYNIKCYLLDAGMTKDEIRSIISNLK